MIRRIATFAAILAIPLLTNGCAVLLTGYLIGDAVQRSKATETCRSNLRAMNEARLSKGQEPFPDQCGQ